jgi:hypothetical protein
MKILYTKACMMKYRGCKFLSIPWISFGTSWGKIFLAPAEAAVQV